MKKTTICLLLLSAALLIQSCSTPSLPVATNVSAPTPSTPPVATNTAVVAPVTQTVLAPVAQVPAAPTTASRIVPQIINLQDSMPGPINVNNQQTMNNLSNDPMLNTNTMITNNNNSGQFSGSAEANLINADGASFENIDQQVTRDINSSNSSINSGNAGISDASKISNELGSKDIENLSVPSQD